MKTKYRINPKTLALERVENLRYWLRQGGINILMGIALGIVFFFVFFWIFPSPRERQLIQQNKELNAQVDIVDRRVNQMQVVMNDLIQRDENLYRVIFQADPIPLESRLASSQDMSYYDDLAKMTNSELVAALTHKVDLLEHEIYTQAKSYEEITELTKTQDAKMVNLPAIQPILNKDLKHIASGFGWRIDPVYHTQRFHSGMDFTAPVGTEVYATGNAQVSFVGWRQGYGNVVVLDHGFGYETLYAHLFKQLVLPGQKVHRGDVIALVGNTGKSTGPHLHYEVHFKDVPVDPRNFYFNDLSPEEYDKMVQISNNFGQMLD